MVFNLDRSCLTFNLSQPSLRRKKSQTCVTVTACLVKAPSGCPSAAHLAHLYFTQARCSNRYGANIPRRKEIASKIAACRIAILNLPCTQGDNGNQVFLKRYHLTRSNGYLNDKLEDPIK